jgi:cytochrome c biogenesis protein CcdA
MARLLVLMISIGLADSINPSTIAPALYLASGKRPLANVAQFTLGVFGVYLAGGCLIALGPGALIRDGISDVKVAQTVRYTGELIAGVLLLAAAALVWRRRDRMVARGMPGTNPGRRSSALLGGTITAIELPTAFPYFAAIAAVVGSGLGVVRGFILLVIFNVCFVLPLLAILGILVVFGDRAERVLRRWRGVLQRRWPLVLVGLLAVVGAVALVFCATGLASGIHGRIGHFFRGVRTSFHLRP